MDLGENLAARQAALRDEIAKAFEGVSRVGGVSWGQSQVISLSGRPDDAYQGVCRRGPKFRPLGVIHDEIGIRPLAFSDHDTTWQDLVNDPAWEAETQDGGFDFLDAIGFRYYVPAAMTRGINRPEKGLPVTALSFEPEELRKLRPFQWSLLNRPQRDAVRSYLHFMIELTDSGDFYSNHPWKSALYGHWIFEELEDDKEEVRREIFDAFQGVNRDGGVSWAEAELIDMYGHPIGEQFHDCDTSWTELVTDPTWDPDVGVGGFSFLDGVGFRYFLAAAMVRSLDNRGQSTPQFALSPGGQPPSEYRLEQWSRISAAQRAAIQSFVRYQMRLSDDDSWDEAWSYWGRVED